MELLRSTKQRSRVSNLVYIVLNVTMALVILGLVVQFNNIWLSILIVLLSKWRIFAVRPRYWLANVITNTVDVVVGVSHVIFLQAASGSIVVQSLMTCGYIFWLLFVKPRSKRIFTVAQAVAAVFVGTNALVLTQYNSDPAVFVAVLWIIGYTSVRHILNSYDEPMSSFYSSIWGVVLAELGWIGFHWQSAYSLPNTGNFKLTQLALITALLTFFVSQAYASYHKHGAIKISDLVVPLVFTFGSIGMLLVAFNQTTVGL
jgi:hypothetical protein